MKSGEVPARHAWATHAERGSMAPMRLMLMCISALPRVLLVPVARLVALYFLISGRRARESSLDYLRRVENALPGLGVRANLHWSYRHFAAFGDSILDKFDAWTGRLGREDVVFGNAVEYEALMSSGRGVLILGSHLGNIEVCRALGSRGRRVKINALVHTRHAEKINRLLVEAGASGFRLWQVTELDAATALALRDRVERGEWVVIAADRVPVHGGRTVMADLLQSPARFPIGPYVLASLLGCPVYLMFCLRRGPRNHIYVEPFAEKVAWRRQDRDRIIAEYAQRFARRLEHYLASAPLQWFNFYPFWSLAARRGRTDPGLDPGNNDGYPDA